jgi:glyoxylase-like metal-dependent hydrolase (beta-lactamase superfamily II)
MRNHKFIYVLVCLFGFIEHAWANGQLEVQPVTKDVYAIVGELGNRTPENFGNNATFGFVVTTEGVVLIDSGGTYEGAKAISQAIKSVTNKPVVKVINTGGQDHRWLGNDFFKKQGAEIIASASAVKDQKERVKDQFFMLGNLVGESAVKSTTPVYAEITFDNEYEFELGGITFHIYHKGPAHTPGDSFVWINDKSVMFTGDIVFVDRMLGVLDHSNSKSWLAVFESMAKFNPKFIVPGHGPVTDIAHAKHDTYDYLFELRQAVSAFVDDGRDMSDISKIDQSKFKSLNNFDILSGRNAQRVFSELEWE